MHRMRKASAKARRGCGCAFVIDPLRGCNVVCRKTVSAPFFSMFIWYLVPGFKIYIPDSILVCIMRGGS